MYNNYIMSETVETVIPEKETEEQKLRYKPSDIFNGIYIDPSNDFYLNIINNRKKKLNEKGLQNLKLLDEQGLTYNNYFNKFVNNSHIKPKYEKIKRFNGKELFDIEMKKIKNIDKFALNNNIKFNFFFHILD